ncbi:MAG: TRAP transporter substrate-binding protein DctP [Burkholderiaceae bacterium]|jgi:TRAP-type mannitol/chloroaromatic compound transport system substrate-binding protein|nr:TRAP transporter substrate-binding protein DctP [Burkholderiaceae bacterium]
MQRRHFLAIAPAAPVGLAGILTAGVAPAVRAQAAAVRWRLASSLPATMDTAFAAARQFAHAVRAMSAGRFEITVHAGGELMPAFGVLDGVQSGAIEMAQLLPAEHADVDPVFALGGAIPFGMSSRAVTAWLLDGNGLKLMRAFYAGRGIVNLPGGNTGVAPLLWLRKRVSSAAALRGVKLRISPLAGRVLAPLGVITRKVAAGDIRTAFEQGRILGAEVSAPVDDLALSLERTAQHAYVSPWWAGGMQIEFFVNAKAWQALSTDQQAIVEAAAARAGQSMRAAYDARNPPAAAQLRQKVLPRRLPGSIHAAAKSSARQLYAQLGRTHPDWKRIYADYARFHAATSAWLNQTTEMARNNQLGRMF